MLPPIFAGHKKQKAAVKNSIGSSGGSIAALSNEPPPLKNPPHSKGRITSFLVSL
jgi:hypothetical protein